MQKRVLLETDVNKRGLQAVFEIAHLSLEDAAHQAFLGCAFDGELLKLAFLHHRDAGFQGFGVDDDFLVAALDGFDEALDFFHDRVGGGADGFHQSLRPLRNRYMRA